MTTRDSRWEQRVFTRLPWWLLLPVFALMSVLIVGSSPLDVWRLRFWKAVVGEVVEVAWQEHRTAKGQMRHQLWVRYNYYYKGRGFRGEELVGETADGNIVAGATPTTKPVIVLLDPENNGRSMLDRQGEVGKIGLVFFVLVLIAYGVSFFTLPGYDWGDDRGRTLGRYRSAAITRHEFVRSSDGAWRKWLAWGGALAIFCVGWWAGKHLNAWGPSSLASVLIGTVWVMFWSRE